MQIKPELLIGAIGVFIGMFGLIWGVWKDAKVRIIQKRADAPHFVVRTLEIYSSGKSIPSGKPAFYTYRDEPCSLDDHLMEMDQFEEEVPDNYPDNRPIGVILQNKGSHIRFFKFSCSEPHVFKESKPTENQYEFKFILGEGEKGNKIRFELWYETSNGFQGDQVWELEKGTKNITRIQPTQRGN